MQSDTHIGKSVQLALFAFLLIANLLITKMAPAQQLAPEFVQSFTMTAGEQDALPFWLTANQFGIIPSQKPSGNVRVAYTLPIENSSAFSYNFGLDVVGRASSQSTLFFQQLYGEVKWGPFLLRAGRKEETAGEVHPSLSLGSMVLSRNAAPVTGISISWPEYVTVPKTGTFLAIKGSIKHGWIEGTRITTNPWLHAKSFYMRFGQDSWGLKAWAGVLHYNIWGGRHRDENIGNLPSSFNDFLRVFFIQGASSNTTVNGEITNVLGNSVGAYDFGLSYQTPRFGLRLYRQFYLEDTVSTRFRSPGDGLWGLSYTSTAHPRWVEDILWEHVNTKKQGSKSFEPRGTDNYYNHFIYSSGWSHRGRTLGTPAILMRPGQVGVFNNILLAHHLGISGSLSSAMKYKLLLTYTRNYGVNSIYRSTGFGFTMENARFAGATHQYYAGLNLSHMVSKKGSFSIFTRIAYDWGDLLPDNNFGLSLGVEHRGGF